MDKSDWITLVVAGFSFLAAMAAQRQSANASRGNNETAIITSRTDAETEAYIRARAMDTETINRQAGEMKDLRATVESLEKKYDALERKYDDVVEDNERLRERIIELEKHDPQHLD